MVSVWHTLETPNLHPTALATHAHQTGCQTEAGYKNLRCLSLKPAASPKPQKKNRRPSCALAPVPKIPEPLNPNLWTLSLTTVPEPWTLNA